MSKDLASLLDLPVAWARVQEDLRSDRVFIKRPFEQALVESELVPWLNSILAEVEAGYSPSPSVVVDVPKGNGAVRAGTYLPLKDAVVYTAGVGACLPYIRATVTNASRRVDYSYGLTRPGSTVWLANKFKLWEQFRQQSIREIDAGGRWVVIGDVTGCYDNITLRTLQSDLTVCGVPLPLRQLLSRILNRWAQVDGRGIPQGYSASDILAKLYLSQIDQALQHLGIRHVRYVDDFRIFCKSKAEARQALVELSRQLRRRGLALQSSKTSIYCGDEGRSLIDGIAPTLNAVKAEYIRKIAQAAGRVPQYLTLHEADELQRESGSAFPRHVLRRAYRTYVVSVGSGFNKSLFHYLLNRLGAIGDPYAVEHALSVLEDRPEETKYVLKYISTVMTSDMSVVDEALASFLRSDTAVYPYQRYEVIAWRAKTSHPPSAMLANTVRAVGRDGSSPEYLRAHCWLFLARFGTHADWELMEQLYPNVASSMDRGEILCCLARMEVSRRNGILGYARGDGPWEGRAVAMVLSGGTDTLLKVGS